jgi:hypothetical protein
LTESCCSSFVEEHTIRRLADYSLSWKLEAGSLELLLGSLKLPLRRLPLLLGLILLAACVSRAPAQGCSACRDTTAGSAPQTRAGLRRAIPILAIPALGIFIGTLVLARKTGPRH